MALCALGAGAQINTDQVLRIGQNALYFDDYVLSIQYFNQVIAAKPYLAQPYLLRAIAKLNLEDFPGAERDASKAIDLNPYITDAHEVRGVARQNLGRDSAAIADYRHALELLPRNRQLLFNIAMAQEAINDYAAADSSYATLLHHYPGFDNGYMGRAKLRLAQGDTASARADLDHAIALNRNATNAYIMRAEININHDNNLDSALSDMDHAIRLMPQLPGLYINRAYMRYQKDNYDGAMADFEYALRLDPDNFTAIYNRALLYAEVGANDRALKDFDRVIQMRPDDMRSRYNRAVVLAQKHQWPQALADLQVITKAYPEWATPFMMRGQMYQEMGQMQKAMAEFDRGKALVMKRRRGNKSAALRSPLDKITTNPADEQEADDHEETPEEVARQMARLLTVDNTPVLDEEYNNKDIRGRVQDRSMAIELQPYMQLTYYAAPTELQPNTVYLREVDDLNATRTLPHTVSVTNLLPALSDEASIQEHFKSIEYYNAYLASHTPRAVDYLGRALDYLTVLNYADALADIDRAIALAPDSPVAYLLRAQAQYMEAHQQPSADQRAAIVTDLRRVIELTPRNAVAHFNLGNVYAQAQDYTTALSEYNAALALKNDLGDAYFNRGYVLLQLGDRASAVADLSRAGELGILPSYRLLKRLSQ